MPTLEFVRPHGGDAEEAVRRIKLVVEDFNARYAEYVDSVEWAADGRSATAKGKRFAATFEVDHTQVHISVELLGLLAKVLKPKVKSKLVEKLDLYFPVAG